MSKKKKKLSILERIKQQPFIIGLIIFYSLAWSWALFTDSLDLAGSNTQGLIVAIFVMALNVTLSVVIVLQGLKFINRLTSKLHPVITIFAALPLLALMDFAVSWLTTIIWLGPEGSIDNVLPLSSPALALINTPLGYAARIVGFYGLAAFGWLILYVLFSKKLRRFLWLPIGLLVLCSIAGYQIYKIPNGKAFKATIISENLDDRVKTIEPGATKLVVFPEYGLDEDANHPLDSRIKISGDAPKTFFLGSQQVNEDGEVGHLNELLYGNSQDGYTIKQDKYRLIPGGEDLPYVLRVLLRATNQKPTLDYFSYAKMVLKGPRPLQSFKIDENTTVGAAVCSSIIAPKDYQAFAANGATVFSNSASLTIFKGSRVFAFQQKSLAKFMAIANSRYFLQSANAATAYALDNNGKQIAEVRGVKTVDVEAVNNTTKTVYTFAGEYLVAVGLLIVSVALFKKLRHQTRSGSKSTKKRSKK